MVKIKHLVINNLVVDLLGKEDQVNIIRDMNQANISFEIELNDIVFRIYGCNAESDAIAWAEKYL